MTTFERVLLIAIGIAFLVGSGAVASIAWDARKARQRFQALDRGKAAKQDAPDRG